MTKPETWNSEHTPPKMKAETKEKVYFVAPKKTKQWNFLE